MTDYIKSVPTYTLAERDRRWNMVSSTNPISALSSYITFKLTPTKTRAYMEEENVEAMIIFGEHEDSGPSICTYDTWLTNQRPGCTVIFPRKGDPICLMPFFIHLYSHHDDLSKGNGGWIAPEQIRLGRDANSITSVLNELGLGLPGTTIGVIGLEPFPVWHTDGIVPYSLWTKVLAQLPDTNFKPVAERFTRMQMALGSEEVEAIRHSAAIGDAMAQSMIKATRPGALESEIYAAGMAAAHNAGTVVPGIMMICGANKGPGIPAWAYRPQAPNKVNSGEVLVAEIFCNSGMRATQHQLTVAIGEVHEDIERAAKVARACYDAGLRALRPGEIFSTVCRAMLKPLEEAGGWARGPQIHSLNPIAAICAVPENMSHLPGHERYPSVPASPDLLGDLKLVPGMTFAFEPSCGFGQNMVCLGGTVIVGEDGAIE